MVKKETIDLQQCLEDLCLSLSHQYLPYHMGLFPFLLDTKPPHFIFGPSMSLYAPFDSLLMFPSKNPSVPYLSVTHRCQASINLAFLCLYTYICIESKLVIVYYHFFPYTFFIYWCSYNKIITENTNKKKGENCADLSWDFHYYTHISISLE